MKVYVTSQQFACIQESLLRMVDSRDPAETIGLLSICMLSNGGDFSPGLARISETEVIVIDASPMRAT